MAGVFDANPLRCLLHSSDVVSLMIVAFMALQDEVVGTGQSWFSGARLQLLILKIFALLSLQILSLSSFYHICLILIRLKIIIIIFDKNILS